MAQRVVEDLQRWLKCGEYDHLTTAELFCLFLTAHLQPEGVVWRLAPTRQRSRKVVIICSHTPLSRN